MHRRRLASILVTAVVLGLVATGSAWLGRRSALNQPAARPSPELPAAANDAPTPASRIGPDQPARAAVARAPLPPQDTPLRLIQAELTARAHDGDAGAACRLAAELQRCEQAERALRVYDRSLQRKREIVDLLHPSQREKSRRELDQDEVTTGQRLLREAERCDGSSPVGDAERIAYWRQATLAGRPGALLVYGTGNAFQWHDFMDVLPQLQTYRQEAERLMLRAAEAGDLRALLALGNAYTPDDESRSRSMLAQSVKPDAARAFALHQYIEAAMAGARQNLPQHMRDKMFEKPLKRLDAMLDAHGRERANQLLSQWQREWKRPTWPEHAPGAAIGSQGQAPYFIGLECGE